MGDPKDSAPTQHHNPLRITRLRPSEKRGADSGDNGAAAHVPPEQHSASRVTSGSSAHGHAHTNPSSHNHSKYDTSPDIPQTLTMPSYPDTRGASRGSDSQQGTASRSRKNSTAEPSKRRSQKLRHGGGFLLNDTFLPDSRPSSRDSHKSKGSRSAAAKGKAVAGTRSGSISGLGPDLEAISSIPKAISMPHMTGSHVPIVDPYAPSSKPSSSSSNQAPELMVNKTRNAHPDPHTQPDHTWNPMPDPTTQLQSELDSAQIVDMALRINHSRRLSLQSSTSQQVPPRLTTIPDVTNTGTLRHHLQQQRRLSRTSSPRPERNINGHRLSVGSNRNPLMVQTAFETLAPLEPAYKHHFSQSTLTRAQKARNHLELMWQYWMLLDALPPITVGQPLEDVHGTFGRPFNPLQYIRNRKVRARERKAIDGESQGFADVARVGSWVSSIKEHGSLLPFETANGKSLETAPVPTKSQVSNKPNRPRLDWEVDPADLIADIYWLEIADNKKYLQNRQWKPIFPPSSFQKQAVMPPPQQLQLQQQQSSYPSTNPSPQLLQPSESLTGMSRYATDISMAGITPLSTSNNLGKDDSLQYQQQLQQQPIDTLDAKQGFDSDHGNSKAGKARHKLHGFKPGHKSSSSNFSHHEIRWRGRNSLSDDSESEMEMRVKRPNRRGTLTSYGKDILEKQMQDRMAQVWAEQQQQQQQHEQQQVPAPSPIATSDKVSDESKPVSRLSSRQGSLLELSEVDEKPAEKQPPKPTEKQTQKPAASPRDRRAGPVMPSRNSLEVPPFNRPSLDVDQLQSRPTTPEFLDVSDSSRPPSPSRNPFHRVKTILRDRSKDRTRDQSIERVPEESEHAELIKQYSSYKESSSYKEGISPVLSERDQLEFAKPTKSNTLKTEASTSSSVREILRLPGTRIDNALRGGFSKLGGLIWRRDDASDSESSDAVTTALQPTVTATDADSGSATKSETPESSSSTSDTPLRPLIKSQQSSRLGALKPPRIDIQAAWPLNNSTIDLSTSANSPATTPTPTPTPTIPNMVHIPLRLQLLMDDPIATRPQRHADSETPFSSALTPASTQHASPPISRRELAHLRTLILSTGIKAMEMTRVSQAPQLTFVEADALPNMPATESISMTRMLLQDVTRLSKNTPYAVGGRRVALVDLHPTAANILHNVLDAQETAWHGAAVRFRNGAAATLHGEIDAVRGVVATDLLPFVRQAADDADEANRNMVMSQGLRAKRAEEAIDKMLRRKRRRFRWLRRGMWLGVEWLLVGIMWSVWLVVTVLGAFMGVGRGVTRAVRWLCWL